MLLGRRLFAEFLGTALLLVAVVGSGIAAQRLSRGDAGLQLLENAAVTAVALVAVILAVGPVSGGHLNPLVTLADRMLGGLSNRDAAAYCGAQLAGALAGTVVANLMFELPAIEVSQHARSGGGLWLGEAVAAFGLVLVVFGVVRSGRASLAPFAVGAYIGGAYWFTSSTSFANPAVTIGRCLTDTFTGIAPGSVPAFVLAQLIGAALGLGAVRILYPAVATSAADVIVPHGDQEVAPMTEPVDRVLAYHLQAIARDLGEEFAGIFSTETIDRYLHESAPRFAAAPIRDFIPVMVERFARERLRALAQAEGAIVKEVPEVLFVCVHNAGRSQMAAALLDQRAHGRVHVRSAGSEPADRINPAVIEAMNELGVDLTKEFPKPLTDEIVRAADVVITMGCGDACPIYPGKRYLDWELDDPAGKTLHEVRPIRDEIARRVGALLDELVPAGS